MFLVCVSDGNCQSVHSAFKQQAWFPWHGAFSTLTSVKSLPRGFQSWTAEKKGPGTLGSLIFIDFTHKHVCNTTEKNYCNPLKVKITYIILVYFLQDQFMVSGLKMFYLYLVLFYQIVYQSFYCFCFVLMQSKFKCLVCFILYIFNNFGSKAKTYCDI